MKKAIAGILTGTMLAATLLGGCAAEGEKGKNETKGEETVELSFWCSALYTPEETKKPQEEWMISKLIEEFEEENPGVTIDLTITDPSTETFSKFKAAAISKSGPDIINLWSGTYLFDLAQVLLPLNEYIPKEDREAITAWNAVQYNFEENGDILAYPVGINCGILLYNKELVKNAGLDFETDPPETTEEFADALEKIKQTGVIPLVQDAQNGSMIMHLAGYWWVQETGYDNLVKLGNGEDNPLGYRWIGIGGNYGIHGTNRPDSVGHYVSNGCVRMVEADVEKVFDKVEVGTEVQIMYNRLVIDKTFDGRVAYYIYPDGYDMQNLTVDFVKQGLKGYGIADFITDEAVAKSIELSNGQPNYVAGPVNIIFNGNKLPYKAVNYKNLIYVPVKALATTLNTPITMDNNLVKTQKGEADVSLYSNVAYMRLTDIANIFDYDYSLNKNLTEITLNKINEPNAITTENTNTQVKEIVVPKKQTDEKINLDGTVIEDTKQNINTVKQDNTKEKVDTKNSNSDVKSK